MTAKSVVLPAAKLNNQGIVFLANGNCNCAIEAMAAAIGLVKAQLVVAKRNSSTRKDSRTSDCPEDSSSCCRSRNTSLSIHSIEISNDTAGSASDTRSTTFPTHSYAIQLFPSSSSNGTAATTRRTRTDLPGGPDDSDLILLSSTIIHNLALAHHHQASISGDGKGRARAERFYNLVLKQLSGEAFINEHTALVVKLACVNNLCHLRYDRSDYKTARRHGLRLLSSHIIRHHSTSRNQEMFSEPEVRGLLFNILLPANEPGVAAAA